MTYIGIDLGGTSVKGGVAADGKMVKTELLRVRQTGSQEEVFLDITTLVANLWQPEVRGIGFAVPALIHFEAGTMYGVTNIPQLNHFPIQKKLEEKFQVPVHLQNDANCFALGEKYFGSAQGYKNVVGLITGTGAGAGVIVNNQIYNGTNCGAGEFGMIPYKDKTFEIYCSGQFFTSAYNQTGEELATQARAGHASAMEAFNEYGKNLGHLINLIGYAYDPEIIVLGGSVSESFTLYEKSMRSVMQTYCFDCETPVKVIPSTTKDIAIYGAVSLFS